jgi:glycosyltransferase involved in cell wall biosynthesis
MEAMAAGLPAVVTDGADTGGLVRRGVSGFVRGRDPAELADALRDARTLDRAAVVDAVSGLSAPRVVHDVFFPDAAQPRTLHPSGEHRPRVGPGPA